MRYRECENCGIEIDVREVVKTCPHCKKNINKPKTENMNKFKKDDKVYVHPYGWGIVNEIQGEYVIVHYQNKPKLVSVCLVSFTEYTLEGFTQERPFEPEIGKYYWFWDDEMVEKKAVILGKLGEIDNEDKFPYYCIGAGCYKHISETNPLL
jgi:hypothetical protein